MQRGRDESKRVSLAENERSYRGLFRVLTASAPSKLAG